MNRSLELKASLACLYAGAVWGLFWIPLRALDAAGLHSLWTITVYFLVPTILVLPVLGLRYRRIWQSGLNLQITVFASGAALTLYSASILYTDVVRALMLFYLMPIWSALLARFVLKEAITATRVVAMGMALVGMLIMFGLGVNFPLPQNVGDWMGLGAGLLWAVTTVRLRMFQEHDSTDLTVGFFIWGLLISASLAWSLAPEQIPTMEQTLPNLLVPVLFVIFLLLPSTYASLWGPKFLNPGIVGLFFMTEIVVGAVSAALFAGEPFGTRELVGVTLITMASVFEPISSVFQRRSQPNHPGRINK